MNAVDCGKMADVFEKAALLIQRVGWWDGQGDSGCKHCAVTAIDEVETDPSIRMTVIGVLRSYLGTPSVARWSDAAGQDVVVAALLQAAKEIRSELEVPNDMVSDGSNIET